MHFCIPPLYKAGNEVFTIIKNGLGEIERLEQLLQQHPFVASFSKRQKIDVKNYKLKMPVSLLALACSKLKMDKGGVILNLLLEKDARFDYSKHQSEIHTVIDVYDKLLSQKAINYIKLLISKGANVERTQLLSTNTLVQEIEALKNIEYKTRTKEYFLKEFDIPLTLTASSFDSSFHTQLRELVEMINELPYEIGRRNLKINYTTINTLIDKYIQENNPPNLRDCLGNTLLHILWDINQNSETKPYFQPLAIKLLQYGMSPYLRGTHLWGGYKYNTYNLITLILNRVASALNHYNHEILLEHAPLLNIVDEDGIGLLSIMHSSWRDLGENVIIKRLLEAKLDPLQGAVRNKFNTPLYQAIQQKNLLLAQLYLQYIKKNDPRLNETYLNTLFHTQLRQYEGFAKSLCEYGAFAKTQAGFDTLLLPRFEQRYYEVRSEQDRQKNREYTEFLLSRNATLDIPFEVSLLNKPLTIDKDWLNLFISYGAGIDERDKTEETLLWKELKRPFSKNSRRNIKTLLICNADPYQKDNQNNSLLSYCVQENKEELAKWLLRKEIVKATVSDIECLCHEVCNQVKDQWGNKWWRWFDSYIPCANDCNLSVITDEKLLYTIFTEIIKNNDVERFVKLRLSQIRFNALQKRLKDYVDQTITYAAGKAQWHHQLKWAALVYPC